MKKMKIAIMKNNKVYFSGSYNKTVFRMLYPIFKNYYIAIIEDNEIKVILTYEEFLSSEV